MSDTEATELKLFIDNTGSLYPQRKSIDKNLATKKARGIYKHDLAAKGFGYLVEAGAKKYVQEFGGTWHKMFDVPTRKRVAEALTRDFEGEYALGNYDYLLPKKYQKPSATVHATKASGMHVRMHDPRTLRSATDRQVRQFYAEEKRDALRARAEAERRGLSVHATKKGAAKWKMPEGLSVRWAPVNNAWFVLWPASAPLSNQQVLKIADTDELHDWLRDTYGPEYGLASRTSHGTHAHARKKQLDREIAHALSSYRGHRGGR